MNLPKDALLRGRGKRQSGPSVWALEMSVKCRHPQTHKDHTNCKNGLPSSCLCSPSFSFRYRTSHTSLSSPVALALAHPAHPTLPAVGTGMGVTPAGNAALAPAGQLSPDPLHCPFLIGCRGVREDMETLGEMPSSHCHPACECFKYRDQQRANPSPRGMQLTGHPGHLGKWSWSWVRPFSPFAPFHR